MRKRLLSLITILLFAIFLTAGCSGGSSEPEHTGYSNHTGHSPDKLETTSSATVLPSFLDDYSDTTKELYALAPKYAELLKQLNCYCGCMEYNDPHDSLYRCFVVENATVEGFTWTDHGGTCGVCLMELRDAAKLADEGKSVDDIKLHIDKTYGGA